MVDDADLAPARHRRRGVNLHSGLWRGERGRVLQQFGEDQHEVGYQRRDHAHVVYRTERHPLVVLDLGERGTQHVGQRCRRGDPCGVPGSGDHEQGVGVAAQAGGEVVQPVQAGQQARVLLVVLQVVDQGELAADQVLGALRHVGEHEAHVAPGDELAFQQQRGRRLYPVERHGQLADLVAGGHVDGGQPRRLLLDLFHVGDPDQLRVGEVGDVGGGAGEALQRVRDGAADDDGEAEHQREQQGRADADRPGGRPRGTGTPAGRVGDLAGHLVLYQPAQARLGLGRGPRAADERLDRARIRAAGQVLDERVDTVRRLALVDEHHQPRLAGVGLLDEPFGEHLRLRRRVGEQRLADLRADRHLDQCHAAQRALLVGAQQGVQRGQLAGAFGVGGPLRYQSKRVDERRHHGVVRPGDGVQRDAAVPRVLPQLGQRPEADQRAGQLVGRTAAQRHPQRLRAVGDGLLLQQHGRVVGVRVGQVVGGHQALALQFPHQRAELPRVAGRVRGRRRRAGVVDLAGDERYRDQRDRGQRQHQEQVELAAYPQPVDDHW